MIGKDKVVIAAYARLSRADGDLGDDGKDESNSIENQKALIHEFIESREEFAGMDVQEYVDDGYTGSNFDRPGFQKMMDAVRQKKAAVIIVKDLSRFGRDYIGVGEYLEQIFPVLNVRFIAINNYYDSKDYIGTTMGLDVAVSNLVNTMYCRDAGKKLHSANEVKWKKGYSTNGSTPFGYVFDPANKGRFKIDPPAAKIVRKIFDFALLGLNTTQIAYQLNEEKIPIPSEYNRAHKIQAKSNQFVLTPDRIWNAGKVWRLLKEYSYTGAMVLGKRRVILSGTNIVRGMPEEKQYITEGAHEAIVTHEEYYKAQEVIRYAGKREYITKNDYPLSKKIRCAHCHRVMQQNFHISDPVVWCRDGRAMPEFSGCSSDAYSIKQIELITFRALRHMLFILGAIRQGIKAVDKDRAQWYNELERLQRKAEHETTMLKGERTRLYEEYASGNISLEEYRRRKEEINGKITSIQASLEQQAAEQPEDNIPPNMRHITRAAEDFLQEDSLTKNAVAAFIDAVYVSEGAHVEVRFRFQDQIAQTLKILQETTEQSNHTGEGGVIDENIKQMWEAGFKGDVLSSYVHPVPR